MDGIKIRPESILQIRLVRSHLFVQSIFLWYTYNVNAAGKYEYVNEMATFSTIVFCDFASISNLYKLIFLV